MKIKTLWSDLRRWLAGDRAIGPLERKNEQAAIDEIERMVRKSDPKMLQVSRFGKKIRVAVRHTMRHVSDLVSQIPGPVVLDPELLDSTPLLDGMFLNRDELADMLNTSKTLKDFFLNTNASEAFALMTARHREKTVFGTEKSGEIIRRDVPRTAIFFEDFKILAPAADLAETRVKIQRLALVSLIQQVLEKIADIQAWKDTLEAQEDLLKFKVDPLQGAGNAYEQEQTPSDDRVEAARQVLIDLHKKIEEVGNQLETPEDHLAHLCQVLRNPERHLKLETVDLKLSRAGIRIDDASTEPVNAFTVAEFALGRALKQAAVWVRVRRTSISAPRQSPPSSKKS